MSLYVTDTHPLIWYASGKEGKLSQKALRAFKSATREETLIYVSPFVLWEVAVLLKIGRIALNEDYGAWAEHLITRPGFDLAKFRVSMSTEAYSYPFSDPFDSVIAATAKVMDLPLITKDSDITDSGLVEIYW